MTNILEETNPDYVAYIKALVKIQMTKDKAKEDPVATLFEIIEIAESALDETDFTDE